MSSACLTMDDLGETLEQLSALSQETRLRVFRYLMEIGDEGINAGSISDAMDIAPNKLSGHLNILVHADLLKVRKDGRRMIYRANVDAVSRLIKSLVETCCHNDPKVCDALGRATCS